MDASGNAFASVSTLSVGSHPVSADFTSSDANVFASSGSLGGGQVVNAADTSTAVSSSVNPSEFGAGVTFTSSTTVSSPGSGTPTGTVQFQDNGANLGPPQNVGGSGQASISTSSLSVGSHSISASFTSGDASFNGSAGTASQTVNRAATVLSYDGAVTADFDDPAALSARLTRASGSSAVAGQPVTLSMGAESCSALTDPTGEAACTITPSEPAGPQTVTAVFAGDANYQPSTDSKPFTVTKEQTTTVYTGAVAIAQGNPVKLTARLLEDGITPIAGRTLTLTLGTGVRSQHCVTGPTDAAGNAQCTLLCVSVAQGPQPVRADFAGDGYYLPSADATKSVIVFAFLEPRHLRPRRQDGRRRSADRELLERPVVEAERLDGRRRAVVVQGLRRVHGLEASRLRRNVEELARFELLAGRRLPARLHGGGRLELDHEERQHDLREHHEDRRRRDRARLRVGPPLSRAAARSSPPTAE